jgi:inner membrane protein
MWVGFWAAAFPDSDFIVRFIDPLTYLTTHRGITHSVTMLPLWALGLAFLLTLIVRRRYSWKAFVGVCALGISSHILGDVVTAFGTMIFAPFSTWRAQIPTTFIIDPYFTSIIVAGLIASMRWKATRAPAVVGFAVLTVYIGFQAILHGRAVAVGHSYIVLPCIVSNPHRPTRSLNPCRHSTGWWWWSNRKAITWHTSVCCLTRHPDNRRKTPSGYGG